MATLYVRRFSFKDSLTDAQLVDEWKFLMNQAVPAVEKVPGVRSCKAYWGAGGLRADITVLIDMDDAAVYERLVADPGVRPLIARLYGSWDLKTATQTFRREVTPQVIAALSGT